MTIDTINGFGKGLFDGGVFVQSFSVDGAGADTVGVGTFALFLPGMQAGYSEITLRIDIGPIDGTYSGKHICLDTCFYPSRW